MENFNLSITPNNFPQTLRFSQGDIGRDFTLNLIGYTIPSGATVKCEGTKPSGFGFTVECTVDGNAVSFSTTEEMTDEAGRFPAQLKITSGGTLLGTANFIMWGEADPHPDGTTDGSQGTIVPELTLLVERIEAAADSVHSLSVEAEASSEPSATYDSETNTITFGIPTGDNTKADAIVETASGTIASFNDGGDGLLIKSLKVNIEPSQSGSGDPSPDNVRPISGWDEVKTVRAGKNIFDFPTFAEITTSPLVANYYSWAIKVNPSTTYYLHSDVINGYDPSGKYAYVLVTNDPTENSNFLSIVHHYNGIANGSITSSSGGYIYLRANSSITEAKWNDMVANIQTQLEVGATYTGYEPYTAETYTTSLPSTVYGGTLDVVSGELVVDKKGVIYNGSENWRMETQAGTQNFYVARPSDDKALADVTADNMLCNVCVIDKMNFIAGHMRVTSGYYNFLLGSALGITTVDGFKTWLASNNITVVYELANPTTIQLTPTEVKSLLGSNNIWADSGTVEVEYRADTTLAFENLKNAILSLGGNI